jgi:23S rRNA pseudouridine1911/1915/1917 synthase
MSYMTESTEIVHRETIAPELAGLRLDQALARLFADYSRSRLQAWIREGRVRLDGVVPRPKDKVLAGQQVELRAELAPRVPVRPQEIPLQLVHQDQHLLVVNKPAGLVVHPAAGNPDGTLQNALLYHDPELERLPRAGIVHRLDKETTGLMVVARTPLAHRRLVEALQARRIKRHYLALVVGRPTAGGTVEAPIGRHPVHRTRMAVVPGGKPAVTHYRVAERFRIHTLLEVELESGRTHQIRVHMAHVHLPLAGDPVYGGRLKLPPGADEVTIEALRAFRRQALHARRLALIHPASGEAMCWEAPLPEDLETLLEVLRRDREVHE